jgi:iron-sulfur cluster assembly accessory protein
VLLSNLAVALASSTSCTLDGDIIREFGAVKVITDKMSDPYLSGATIDFVDTIEKQGFTIDNPNAAGSCACGDSFN